ncbi:MAG: beta-lactamase family protein, partial [Salinivirgaceae bacterium]|nr:beta-lactamase family protein [Salinivirgaceae bacterium]
ILILLSFSCAKKHNNYTKKIQSDLDRELAENNSGILVNVNSLDKDFIWSGASGLSDKEAKTKLLPDQTFRIASVTKTFVAATILRLWEDNKISLDDPITKFVSEKHINILKNGGYKVDKILIKHLLTHSSGLSEHTNSYKFEVAFLKTKHVWSRTEQISDLIIYSNPVGDVGEKFSYSDTGYILLGEIIENVTGKSMGDAILEQLDLKKLGIKDTYMEDFNGDFSGRRIHQYQDKSDTYYFHPSMDYYGGGGLLSTTADLSCFFQNLFNHKIFHNRNTLDTMLTPIVYNAEQPLDYRMGVWKIDIEGKIAYTHSGFWGTQVIYIPEIRTAIATNYSQHWTQKGIAPIIPKILKTITQSN